MSWKTDAGSLALGRSVASWSPDRIAICRTGGLVLQYVAIEEGLQLFSGGEKKMQHF